MARNAAGGRVDGMPRPGDELRIADGSSGSSSTMRPRERERGRLLEEGGEESSRRSYKAASAAAALLAIAWRRSLASEAASNNAPATPLAGPRGLKTRGSAMAKAPREFDSGSLEGSGVPDLNEDGNAEP